MFVKSGSRSLSMIADAWITLAELCFSLFLIFEYHMCVASTSTCDSSGLESRTSCTISFIALVQR